MKEIAILSAGAVFVILIAGTRPCPVSRRLGGLLRRAASTVLRLGRASTQQRKG